MMVRNTSIFNAYAQVMDMMKRGNGPIMLLSPKQMFEMGEFYQWSKKFINKQMISLDAEAFGVEIPNEFGWVVGETQGW